MADNRTMAQMLQAPIEGYEDAIVVPPINANNFELKQPLINLVQSNKFTGRQDPHNHLRFFNKVTSTFRHPEVPNTSIKLLLFPFSLDGEARDCCYSLPHPQALRKVEDKMTIKMNQMMNQMKALVVTTPAPVKAVEEVCVTCGSNHNFNHCPLTRGGNDFPVFHDNIQQFQQTAAVGNFLQRNQPSNLASQMRPPGFNQPNVQNNQNRGNFNRQNNQNQVYQAPPYQPPINQVLPYQPPTNSVSKTDFESYVKANDAVLKNVQNQNQGLQNQMTNVTSLLTSLCTKINDLGNTNQASSSSTLPSNTVPNPRNEAKAITTRSGVSYEGPSIPMPPPFVNPDVVEETSTDPVPPPLTQKVQETNSQTTTKVNQEGYVNCPKTYELKLPYPERRNVEKRQDKDKVQLQKFWKMFKQLHFNISLADALILMPKYTKMLKDLCANKEKLKELANTPLSENYSAVILKKMPEKLGDSCRFTIPCDFSKLKCQGLADLGASINLMPLSVFHRLGFTNLESTQMTLELANRQLCRPDGICKDVLVPVGKFTYPADFVVVDYAPDEQIPLILGRPFLRTARALIDVYDEKLILRDGNESLTLNMQSEKSKLNGIQRVESINMIDIFNVPNYIGFKDLFAQMYSGNPTIQSNDSFPSSSPMKTSDFTFEEFTDEFTLPNSLPPGDDVSTLKKNFQEDTFRIISNPLFEFDDSFKSSNVNPLFEENDKDVEIKSSSSFTLTSPEVSELEAYLEKDSIPPGIDLTLPPTFKVSSSNPTSLTLTGEKKPKPLSQEVEEIKDKEEDEVSSDVPIHTIVMPIRITFDNPIDFNDHFSKPKDIKKDLTISFDSSESRILPSPLLDSDSPFTAELSASVTLNSLRNEDKVFKPGILVYHAIHDKNLVTLEENLKENISSGTLLIFKEPSFLLPPSEPPDECLKNVVLNFYQNQKTFPLNVEDVNSFTFIIWTFLPFFTYSKESPLNFSFRSENFIFDPGIITFHNPVAVSMKVSHSTYCSP
ncbi:reverse transcriptase domain-containing protein [Tanacetum coccineum]|uniref:Reverse transcriptase domain-containing protein n=1 Tax=Tanacetum coccineum TaxID=301880 RepID=A0ABQ5DAX8_9ASTR